MKVLDLFSGIGGFSLGLERAGMSTVAFCEIDPFAQSILKSHWPLIPIFNDVKELKGSRGMVDVICGGFPCQDISIAGNKKGFKDENGNQTRSGLWYEFKRLIREIKPKYVLIENVGRLTTNGLTELLQDLCEIGYDSEWEVIPATAVGLPHLRERIWIVAYPGSKRFDVVENPTQGRNIFRHIHRYAQEKEEELREKLELWSRSHASIHRELSTAFWESQSGIPGVVNGLPRELVKEFDKRIKCMGNTIIPKFAELIGRGIYEHEQEKQDSEN